MSVIVGWDIGGANLKLAIVDAGRVVQVVQIPCPIRQDRSKFDEAFAEAMKYCSADAAHVATMTGELSDVFADRQEGVAYLVALLSQAVEGQLRIYGGRAGFLPANQVGDHISDIASANWHASAALAARHHRNGLLIDVGTTTTDLIPFAGGNVTASGYTDGERLAEGELIYTGVVRTPVVAIASSAPFRGRLQGIAAERFATMADVYRLTGDLPEDADPFSTADQRGKSEAESAARLARMLGRDAAEAETSEWIETANYFRDCQLRNVEQAASALLARERLDEGLPIVGAGCGRFLAQEAAQRSGRPYRDFAELIDCADEAREMAARCAPAVAVALLAGR